MSLIPPFTFETATAKVKKAQDLWNTQNPEAISKAYTDDSIWRNRDKFFTGHEKIVEFLTWKWQKEKSYTLRKELFSWTENKIAVQFWYEYQGKNAPWSHWRGFTAISAFMAVEAVAGRTTSSTRVLIVCRFSRQYEVEALLWPRGLDVREGWADAEAADEW